MRLCPTSTSTDALVVGVRLEPLGAGGGQAPPPQTAPPGCGSDLCLSSGRCPFESQMQTAPTASQSSAQSARPPSPATRGRVSHTEQPSETVGQKTSPVRLRGSSLHTKLRRPLGQAGMESEAAGLWGHWGGGGRMLTGGPWEGGAVWLHLVIFQEKLETRVFGVVKISRFFKCWQ